MSVTVYPYVDYETGFGTFRAGLRTKFNSDGYNGVSIPFSWTKKFSM